MRSFFAIFACMVSFWACGSQTGTEDERAQIPELVGVGQGTPPVIVESDGSTHDAEGAPRLGPCEVQGVPSVAQADGSWLLDDFEDGDGSITENGLRGYWFSFGDGSAGTQNTDPFVLEPGGRDGSAYALRVVGGGYTTWGSVNAATLVTQSAGTECLFDASVYDGISFWLKGSIELEAGAEDLVTTGDQGVLKVQFHELRTFPLEAGGTCDPFYGECWNSYRYRAEPTSCWTHHAVRFADFEQDEWGQKFGDLDTSQLVQFALEVGAHHEFDYQIDDIEFFIGDPPEQEQQCDSTGIGGAGGQGS